MSQKPVNSKLNEILDFGPETVIEASTPRTTSTHSNPDEVNERILKIIRSLKELGERIDRLSSRI